MGNLAPILIGAIALLALAGGRKKSGGQNGQNGDAGDSGQGGNGNGAPQRGSSRRNGNGAPQRGSSRRPPPRGSAKVPGTLCFGPEQEDRLLQEVGLWNDGGQCVTFWSDGSAQAVEEEILSIMEDRGIAVDELCELVRDPDDPYSPLSEWNATFLDVVAEALGNLYGSGAPKHTWPPQEGLSPEWMHEAWTRAEAVASERVCGIQSPFT